MKIMCACGSGLGSSLMVSMKVKEIVQELGINAEVEHTDLSSLAFQKPDLCILGKDVAMTPEAQRLGEDKIISLDRIMDKEEIRSKLKAKLGL